MKLSSFMKWPYWKFRTPWPDHVHQFDYLDWNTQRHLVYQQIDKGGFGYWSVAVAGIGFLTDSYDIFAVNTVLPMLGLVYWKGHIPQSEGILISLSLLVGTFFGQLILGVLGDRYGRRKLYGIELVILTVATVLMALASKGALAGTNRVAWISSWRFIMGFGIGGDYPLSAVITAEFAPRKHRGRMLSSLFFMQATGALIANIVTSVAVYVNRNSLPSNSNICDDRCVEVVDIMWRWIVGIGAIPPALAICLRWCIPESPRYTMEVEQDLHRAKKDVMEYFPTEQGLLHTEDVRSVLQTEETVLAESASRHSSNHQQTLTFGETIDPMELKTVSVSEASTSTKPKRVQPRKESWKEWIQGFREHLTQDGNWTDLAGMCLSWMTLDFAFYGLGVNNPKILNKLWHTEGNSIIYTSLMAMSYRAMVAVSLGSVIGGGLFIFFARYRWKAQLYGFWILAVIFIIVGICYVTLLGTRYFAAVIVLYSICSLFFSLGPNTSTYVLSAEVFPTKYRSSCHGIAAAAGKLGSIFAQIFLAYVRFGSPGMGITDEKSSALGWVLLVFSAFMVIGAIITQVWCPNPVDIFGRSRTLEDLGKGKAWRKRREKEELDIWRTFAPDGASLS